MRPAAAPAAFVVVVVVLAALFGRFVRLVRLGRLVRVVRVVYGGVGRFDGRVGVVGVVGLVGLVGLAGCSVPVVGVRLKFPSQETFLVTNTVTIDVYDGTGAGAKSPDAICRALSVENSVAPDDVLALESSGNTAACRLLDGGVAFQNVDVGRRVFFAEAVDFKGTAIMRGCTVADVFGDAGELADDEKDAAQKLGGATSFVSVQLATLPTYQAITPTCADVKAKCQENQQCVPP